MLNFNDTEKAFAYKTDQQLKKQGSFLESCNSMDWLNSERSLLLLP